MKQSQFLIKKGDVYYLTTGELLTYDAKAAKDPKEKESVDWVAREFKRMRDSPHTWYEAVHVDRQDFRAINTGIEP